MTLGALLGVSPLLPISSELRLGLESLVLGAGLVAYSAGIFTVLERVDDDPEVATTATAETPSSTDGD